MKIILILFLTSLVSISNSVKAEDEPRYLKHRADFIQQKYSEALVGFAFDRKCNFLEKSLQIDYEKNMNGATEIFKGYILANKMIQSPNEASNYVKEMVHGTIRYSARSNCDALARERTSSGFDTAKNFLSFIDVELQKDMNQ